METPDGWGNGEIGKWGNAGRGAELAAKSACEWEWKWVHVESAKWQPSASRLLFLLFLRLCFSVLLAFSFGGKGSMLDFFWLQWLPWESRVAGKTVLQMPLSRINPQLRSIKNSNKLLCNL